MSKSKKESNQPDPWGYDIDLHHHEVNMHLDAKINAIMSRIEDAPSGRDIFEECLKIADNLIRKNISYGDSALDLRPIFLRAGMQKALRHALMIS
jgi:hypothetical protein